MPKTKTKKLMTKEQELTALMAAVIFAVDEWSGGREFALKWSVKHAQELIHLVKYGKQKK